MLGPTWKNATTNASCSILTSFLFCELWHLECRFRLLDFAPPTMITHASVLELPCWMFSKNCYVLVMPLFFTTPTPTWNTLIFVTNYRYFSNYHSPQSIKSEQSVQQRMNEIWHILYYRILSPISDILLLNKACSAATAYNLRSTAPWRWLAICLKHSQVPASIISDLTYWLIDYPCQVIVLYQ